MMTVSLEKTATVIISTVSNKSGVGVRRHEYESVRHVSARHREIFTVDSRHVSSTQNILLNINVKKAYLRQLQLWVGLVRGGLYKAPSPASALGGVGCWVDSVRQ